MKKFSQEQQEIKTIEHVKKQVIDTIPPESLVTRKDTVQKIVETIPPVPPPISENVDNVQENVQEKIKDSEIKK